MNVCSSSFADDPTPCPVQINERSADCGYAERPCRRVLSLFAVCCILYLLSLPSLRDINLEYAEGSDPLEPPAGDSFAVGVAPTVSLKSVGLAPIVVSPKSGDRDHTSAFPCLTPSSPLTVVDAIELDREPTGFHGVAFRKSPTVTSPERDLNSDAM